MLQMFAVDWLNGFIFASSCSKSVYQHMTCSYMSLTCPVADYASPVWHSSLTVKQSNQTESIPKHAWKIILNNSTSGDCAHAFNCMHVNLPQLAGRPEQITRHFIVKMMTILYQDDDKHPKHQYYLLSINTEQFSVSQRVSLVMCKYYLV